ncbi:MAG TPA: hypothetical protein VFH44_00210, partial [Solirubrobacterales bacterium]|nr:hypothetical protein [Solirubrobacterales bacterium]
TDVRAFATPRTASSSGSRLTALFVRVYDWAPKGLPARPATIKLDRVSYGSYECSGRSHSLAFHENGRGIDINVWFVQGQADPAVRHQAVELLNSLEVREFPSRECHRDLGVTGDHGFRGADGLSCGEAALLWNEWIVPPEKLTPCPKAGATHDLRVTDGITCGIAERFILGGTRGFAPHPGGWIERKERFTCRIREFESSPGLHVDCLDTDRGPSGPRFTFRFF